MSNSEIGMIVLTLCVLLSAVHVFGYLSEKLRQPRLIGEILAGVILGPTVLGQLFPSWSARLFGSSAGSANKIEVVLNFIYWIGLFLLMFLSGAETRRIMAKENRRETMLLFGIGTLLPFFFVLMMMPMIPLDELMGSANSHTSALLVLAIGVAVTSIPVISRIFFDLKIIHTRFASLVLGFAVLEDIVLWGVLAVATGIIDSKMSSGGSELLQRISIHILATFAFMGIGLTVAPLILKKLHDSRWNLLIKASPVGYLFVLLFVYASVAAALDVNVVFAAFLAGFGLVGGRKGTERARFSVPLEAISRVSSGVFIPIYFAVVGYKLGFGQSFSFLMFASFFLISSIIVLISFSIAAGIAGFRGWDIINLSITKNARGGPGIVLASVAYDAGIINGAFYTTLVLTAVLTSQVAGSWLRFVLSKGWPLLSTSPSETWVKEN